MQLTSDLYSHKLTGRCGWGGSVWGLKGDGAIRRLASAHHGLLLMGNPFEASSSITLAACPAKPSEVHRDQLQATFKSLVIFTSTITLLTDAIELHNVGYHMRMWSFARKYKMMDWRSSCIGAWFFFSIYIFFQQHTIFPWTVCDKRELSKALFTTVDEEE